MDGRRDGDSTRDLKPLSSDSLPCSALLLLVPLV